MNEKLIPATSIGISAVTAVGAAWAIWYGGQEMGALRQQVAGLISSKTEIGALAERVNRLETSAAVLTAQQMALDSALRDAIERLEREDRRIRRDMQRDGQR